MKSIPQKEHEVCCLNKARGSNLFPFNKNNFVFIYVFFGLFFFSKMIFIMSPIFKNMFTVIV